MATRTDGRNTIEYLLDRDRLERIDGRQPATQLRRSSDGQHGAYSPPTAA